MRLEWSRDALDDLDRFADFLHEKFPTIAPRVAKAIMEKARSLSEHPYAGRAIAGSEKYRQAVISVLGAAYVLQYRVETDRLVLLPVFHGREGR